MPTVEVNVRLDGWFDAVQGLNVLSTPDAYIVARNIRGNIFCDPNEIVDAYIDRPAGKMESAQIDLDDSKGIRKYSQNFLRQVTVAKQTFSELAR